MPKPEFVDIPLMSIGDITKVRISMLPGDKEIVRLEVFNKDGESIIGYINEECLDADTREKAEQLFG